MERMSEHVHDAAVGRTGGGDVGNNDAHVKRRRVYLFLVCSLLLTTCVVLVKEVLTFLTRMTENENIMAHIKEFIKIVYANETRFIRAAHDTDAAFFVIRTSSAAGAAGPYGRTKKDDT